MFIKRTPVFLLALIAAVGAKEIVPAVPSQSLDGCYQISTAAELYGFAEIVNGNDSTAANPSVCGELTKDVVVNKDVLNGWDWLNSDSAGTFAVWKPMVDFAGKFNGNGHTISGLYSPDNAGLFESIVSPKNSVVVIRDLGIIDSYFSSTTDLGVLVNSVSGKGEIQITNFYSQSTIESTKNSPDIAAVVGYVSENTALTLTNCYGVGKLVDSRYNYYSDLLGYAHSKNIKVENSYALKVSSTRYIDYGTLMDTIAFLNGAVTFLLKENSDGAIWGQDVGNDYFPIFSGKLKNSIAARYNVTFHTFDGDTTKYYDTYVAGLTTELPRGTSAKNLVFGGWYRDAEFTGENETEISNKTTGNLEYWARMYDRYKVTYHPNGGVRDSGSFYACGNPTSSFQDAILLTDSVECYLGGIGGSLSERYHRDSSIFWGWYDNEELKGAPVDSIKTSDKGDKHFYAKWFEYKRPPMDLADSCYIISDAEELYGFSALVDGSFATGKYNEKERLDKACGKLTKDIVVNENVLKRDGTLDSARMRDFLPWKPIAFYKGYFDGQGHTISGLYIEGSGEGSGGVFSDANPRYTSRYIAIRNLKVKDSFISNDYDAGGIICSNTNSTTIMEIENTHFDGAIYARGGAVGGLVSEAHNLLIIRNSSHRGLIHTTSSDVGGIVGHVDEFTVLVQNYNEGSIVSVRPPVEGFVVVGPVGGLVGEVAGNFFIANNYNVANIETKGRYGGLIGAYYVGNMGKCLNETCRPDRSFVLNNYSKGRVIGDWPAKMYDSEVTFENNFYLDGTLPEDSIGTPVKAEAFEDGTVTKALHDYVLKDSTGAEVAGGVRGDNWIQGDEYPVFSLDETRNLVLLYVTGYVELPSNVLFYTPGQVLPLPMPSRYGYSFAGWKWGDDIVTEIPATVSEDQAVSPRWQYIPSSSSVASSSSEASSSSVAKSSSSEAKSSSSTAKSSSSADGKSSSSKGKDAIATMDHVPQFSLTAAGRSIQVAYAPVGAAYAVFDMQGRIIARGRVHSQNFGLTLSQAGGYLVSIGDQVQKVFIR